MSDDRNDRIREIAYFLWLDEGCPEGEAERHWSTAEAMHDSQPSERKRLEGEPPGEEPVRADPNHPPSSRGIAGFSAFVIPVRQGRERVSLSASFLFPMLHRLRAGARRKPGCFSLI